MEDVPQVRYARSGDAFVAFQAFGAGDIDVVVARPFGHLHFEWEEPRIASFLRRLGSFGRVVLLDNRGNGMSDPLPPQGSPLIEMQGVPGRWELFEAVV